MKFIDFYLNSDTTHQFEGKEILINLNELVTRLAFAALFLIVFAVFARAQELKGMATVIDGDTLEIHGQRIRLHGIDAPESRQLCSLKGSSYLCGQKSSRALSDRIRREPISCQSTYPNPDRYGRIIAKCYKEREDLNAWMVLNGWAVAYVRYSTDYVQNEEIAKLSKSGVWAGEFVMPEDWRKGIRLESEGITENLGTCTIKGNISRGGKRIYHVPGGKWYERTKIDTSKGERLFCSEDEAIAKGWRKSSQ